MKYFVLFILFLLSFSSGFSYVFLNSVPSGADVMMNNKKIGTTPLLIKEDITGKQSFVFKKEGYHTSTLTSTLSSKITNLYSILTPDTFSLYFPDKTSVVINSQNFDNEEIRNIPSGYYHFMTDKDSIKMDRINPNRKYLIFSLIMTGIGLTTGIVAHYVGNNAYTAYTNNTDPSQVFSLLENSKFLDILSWSGYGLAGLGGGFSIYFGVDALIYKKKNQTIKIDSQKQSKDNVLYNQALDYLSQGNIDQAKDSFTQVITRYPESKYLPVSLLRRASILNKQQQYSSAIKDLETIRDKYPIYEIYEIAVKSLADSYFQNKIYDEAIRNYQEIKGLHENYSEQEIDFLILKCKTEQTLEQKSDASSLRSELQKFLTSPNLAEDLRSQAQALLDRLP